MTDTPWWRPDAGPSGHIVACIGETMAALIPPGLEALEDADTLRVDIAGAESNVAMYLADHGVRARWVSRLGADAFGRRVARTVGGAGVELSGVHFDPTCPTGLLFKDPAASGTRVTYYRRGSAASAMGPEILESQALRTATLWHLSGITPALSQSCLDLVRAALAVASGTRPRPRPAVSFDVNYRPALWAEPPGELLRELADRADIVFVGLDEARALWGDAVGDATDVRALLSSPHVLIVKDGPVEATAFYDTAPAPVVVPAPRVEVVEAVGAGDAFAAGFLAALLEGRDPVHCLRSGHLTAAAALCVTGDHGPLSSPETRARLLAADEAAWAAAAPFRAPR